MAENNDLSFLMKLLNLTDEDIKSLQEIRKYKSFKEWMRNNFEDQELKDMVEKGVDGGFSMLTYYSETYRLYVCFHKDIWEMLTQDSENNGYKNPFEFIATFKGANIADNDQFANLLVWYAAERVASDLIG